MAGRGVVGRGVGVGRGLGVGDAVGVGDGVGVGVSTGSGRSVIDALGVGAGEGDGEPAAGARERTAPTVTAAPTAMRSAIATIVPHSVERTARDAGSEARRCVGSVGRSLGGTRSVGSPSSLNR